MYRYVRMGEYTVSFCAYSGVCYDLGTDLDAQGAKEKVRAFLRASRRAGKPVAKLGKGEWEVMTPDDACAVSDREGILTMRPTVRRYRVILGRKVYC